MKEKITNRIKYKLQNKDLNFTADELLIIKDNQNLTEDIIRILSLDVSYWNTELAELIFSNVAILENMPQIAPEDVRDNFVLRFIEYICKTDEISYEQYQDYMKSLNPSSKIKKQAEYLFEKRLNDDTRKLTIFMASLEYVQELLNNKYYYELSNINRLSSYMESSLMERIINEFPFEKYETPPFLADCPVEMLIPILDKLSIHVLDKIASKHEDDETILNAFLNKLKKTRFSDVTFIRLSRSFDPEILNKISEYCFNNNIGDYLDIALITNQFPKEEIITKTINYINRAEELSLEKIIFLLKDEERVISALIKNGWITELVNYHNLTQTELNEIVANINGIIPKYKRYAENFIFNNYIQEYPAILESIANHPKLEVQIEPSTIIQPAGEDFLIKCIRKNKKVEWLNLLPDSLEKILIELIKNNRFDEVLMILPSFASYNKEERLAKILLEENEQLTIDLIENTIAIPTDLAEFITSDIIKNPNILKAYLSNDYALDKLLEQIYHHEALDYFYTQENVLLLKEYFANKYNVDIEKILIISNKIGPKIIKYIQNENIQELLRLEDNDFYKILNLFEKEEYTLKDLEASYDSLKQYEFSKKHPEIINIFNNTMIAIENNKKVDIKDIYKYLDKSFFEMIKEMYELPEEYNESHPKEFLLFVIAKITQNPRREKYKELFHKITNYYIAKKREEYRNTYALEEELELEYNLVEKSVSDELLKYCLTNCNIIQIEIYGEMMPLSELIARKLRCIGMGQSLITDCINYITKASSEYTNDLDVIKEQTYKMLSIVKQFSKNNELLSAEQKKSILQELVQEGRIKKKYYLKERTTDIYDLLSELNIKVVKETINNNENVYKSLKQLLKKYKLLSLPDELKKLISSEYINMNDDYTNIVGFITYYKAIMDSKSSEKKYSLPEILIKSDIYGEASNVYSQILGAQDYKLIKSNPGPNAAVNTKGRLDKAVEYTVNNYKKMEVTIPTFNEVINIGNKNIRVVVGNFTSPETLTYGERTGACMRIGGAGETLFDFILQNPNGFHIKFEDPSTGEFISRVSGFRNGNSIFLNQLRSSKNEDKYTNVDLITACELASKRIIELSEPSSYPIQNVFVGSNYAMAESLKTSVNFNAEIKKGLPYFYSDISYSGIILATKAKGNSFVPINVEGKLPTYLPAREHPIETNYLNDIINMIERVNAIKKILNGTSIEYLEQEALDDIQYGIANHDWYIYVDNDGVIHKELINLDERAKMEFDEYLSKVEKTYGGTSWLIA